MGGQLHALAVLPCRKHFRQTPDEWVPKGSLDELLGREPLSAIS